MSSSISCSSAPATEPNAWAVIEVAGTLADGFMKETEVAVTETTPVDTGDAVDDIDVEVHTIGATGSGAVDVTAATGAVVDVTAATGAVVAVVVVTAVTGAAVDITTATGEAVDVTAATGAVVVVTATTGAVVDVTATTGAVVVVTAATGAVVVVTAVTGAAVDITTASGGVTREVGREEEVRLAWREEVWKVWEGPTTLLEESPWLVSAASVCDVAVVEGEKEVVGKKEGPVMEGAECTTPLRMGSEAENKTRTGSWQQKRRQLSVTYSPSVSHCQLQ